MFKHNTYINLSIVEVDLYWSRVRYRCILLLSLAYTYV